MKQLLLTLFAAALTGIPAQAGFIGSTNMEFDYYNDNTNNPGTTAPSSFVSPSFTQFATPFNGIVWTQFSNWANVTFTDTQITFVASANVFAANSANGIRFSDSNNTLPAITALSVSATGGLNLTGRTFFDSNAIFINFSGLTTNGQTVTVTPTFVGGSSAPEPSTYAMMGAGLAGLLALRRRR